LRRRGASRQPRTTGRAGVSPSGGYGTHPQTDARTDLLSNARRLIDRGWTQHADARADDDRPVQPWDARAASWSLLGALVAAVEEAATTYGERVAFSELARTCILLADTLDSDSLKQWNDSRGRTRTDVLAALDQAGTQDGGPRREPYGHSLN
jgi:hypothetical protein